MPMQPMWIESLTQYREQPHSGALTSQRWCFRSRRHLCQRQNSGHELVLPEVPGLVFGSKSQVPEGLQGG